MTWRIAAMAVIVGTAGCSSLQPLQAPAQFITAASPDVVYVTHRSRALIVIANPRVSGDTVYGTWQGQTRPVALPLSQVQSVAAVRRDGTRTAFLVAGVGMLAGVAVYAFLQSNAGREPWVCDWNHALPECG